MADNPAPRDGAQDEPVVELLVAEWTVLAELLGSLAEDDWQRSALPGWTVHDVVAHVIGGERMLSGAPRPEPATEGADAPHVRNDIGRFNEAWVAALQPLSPAEMLAALRKVTAERVGALQSMAGADFDAPSWTPAGQGTYRRFMEIRVFDTWMHEQDIRAAVGRPGNESGPIAEQALAEVVGALGYIVGKRVGAPDGSGVCIFLTGPIERELCVAVEGRARVVASLAAAPTASISLSSSLFLRLAGGREDPDDALARVQLGGDPALARSLATRLAYTI